MTEERRNPCGNDKEIDEYLDGTMCEVVPGEEELNDIQTPGDEEFDVAHKTDAEEVKDEYLGKK